MFLLGLGLAGFLIHWLFIKKNALELLLRYLILFSFGVSGIVDFGAHVFYPNEMSQYAGWPIDGPFQFEVGIANLGFGLLAVLSFWIRGYFLTAALLGNVIWLWGDALAHILYLVKMGGFSPGHAGIYVWEDVLIPLLIVCVYFLYKRRLSLR